MAPRPYDATRRLAAREETRRRIVKATMDLHAERGILGTTHALIAERADVALPTVYNHFRSRADLVGACGAAVEAGAPCPLGPELFAGVAGAGARLAALVRAIFTDHAYHDRWLRILYHEVAQVPELQPVFREKAALLRRLVESALGRGAPREAVAAAEALLSYPSWRTLVMEERLPVERAEAAVVVAIEALLAAKGAKNVDKNPSRRKS